MREKGLQRWLQGFWLRQLEEWNYHLWRWRNLRSRNQEFGFGRVKEWRACFCWIGSWIYTNTSVKIRSATLHGFKFCHCLNIHPYTETYMYNSATCLPLQPHLLSQVTHTSCSSSTKHTLFKPLCFCSNFLLKYCLAYFQYWQILIPKSCVKGLTLWSLL